MAFRPPANRHGPRTTVVVQVAEDGTATLYLGTELVEHAVGVDSAALMRLLIDYAASIDTSVRVTTQMPDGTWTRHWLDPDGTIRETSPTTPSGRQPEQRPARPLHGASLSSKRSGLSGRFAPRAPLIAVFVLLAAALVAATISVTSP
jgi:hypothetical protein